MRYLRARSMDVGCVRAFRVTELSVGVVALHFGACKAAKTSLIAHECP